MVPPSCFSSGRVGIPAMAPDGPLAVPRPAEAAPDWPPSPGWGLWWPSGPGAAPQPRSPAAWLSPQPPGRQVPVPLLPSNGRENSRAAMAPSSPQG